jgi:hypothetical protein
MDTSEMQELLQGYLSEMDWTGGATKDDLMRHLVGRDDALRTLVNLYVPEGTYQDSDAVMNLIPAQAWEDVQGDDWRGAESQYVEDVPTHFQDGPVGQDTSDVGRPGDSAPPTPGFGQSAGASGGASGSSGVGDVGSNAGEVDPGVSGIGETRSQS